MAAKYTNRRSLAHDIHHLRLDMNRVFECFRYQPDFEKKARRVNTNSQRIVRLLNDLNPSRQPLYAHAFTTGDIHNVALAATEFSKFNVWAAAHFGKPEGDGWTIVPFWWPRHKSPNNFTVVMLAIVVSSDQKLMTPVPLFGYDRV
nr:hypothetical protein [Brevundimonas diminuta]